MNPQHQQKRKIWQSCCHKFYPPTVFHPAFQLLAQMAHVRSHGRKWVHPRFCSEDRTQGHTRRNRGRFRWGWYHCPRSVPHVSETLRGRVYSRRTQKAFGTAMRLCVSLSRGVAAPLGCVIFLQFGDVAVFSLCAQYFLNVQGGRALSLPSACSACC